MARDGDRGIGCVVGSCFLRPAERNSRSELGRLVELELLFQVFHGLFKLTDKVVTQIV